MPKLVRKLKINIPAGKATPAPPVGQALGQNKIPIMPFCKEFNERTATMTGIVPAEISLFDDGSFTFILKTPPTGSLILEAVKTEKGSGKPNKEKIGTLTKKQLEQIATTKLPDLNANTVEQAMRVVAGTARSMGVKVEE